MPIVTDGLKYYWNVKHGIQSGNVLHNIAPSGATSNISMMGNASLDVGAEAIYLDAVSGYLELANNSVFNSSPSYTYEYIFDTKQVFGSGYYTVIGDGAYMDIDFDNNGVYWQLMQNNSTRIGYTAVTTDIDTMQRLHVVVQYDKVAQVVRGYVNGVLRLETTGVNGSYFFSRDLTDVVRFSRMAGEPALAVNFRSFRFYDRALTSGEIATNYANVDSIGLENPDPSTLPVLSGLTPANNTVITSSSATITAVVNDAEGHVSDVVLQISKTQDFASILITQTQSGIASGGTATFNVTGLGQGNHYWRLRANRTGYTTYTNYTAYYGLFANIPATGKLYPDAILQQTGYTGAVTAIDENPDTPDGNWLTTVTTPTADTILRVSFPSPPLNLKTGAGLQNFKILVRKNKVSTATGTMTIGLYESNVLKGTASLNTVDGNTTTLTYSWDASILTAVSGVNVEARMLGNGYTGKSGGTRFGIEIGAVEWNYETIPETQANAPAVVTDTTPPAEVTSLAETHGFTTANLTWVNPTTSDFSHVRILRNGVQIATNQTGTSYADSGLATGTQYTYLLKTVDTTGNQSTGVSIVLTTNIPDTTAPVEVTNLAEVHTVDTVTLTWTNPADADFSHVRLLRNGSQIATNITAETYADSGLSASTQYTYLLKTVDDIGNESTGVSIIANTTAPPAETPPLPTLLVATRSKLSDEISKNVTNLTISFDKDVTEWTVNVLGSDPFTGTVADSGGTVLAGAEITAIIDWTELYQEGQNRINVYGKTATGVWTPYGSGSVIDGGVFIGETFSRTINGGVYEGETFARSFDGDVDKIKFRRGLKADLPILEEGEMALCTDTKEIYIGSDEGNILLNGDE